MSAFPAGCHQTLQLLEWLVEGTLVLLLQLSQSSSDVLRLPELHELNNDE